MIYLAGHHTMASLFVLCILLNVHVIRTKGICTGISHCQCKQHGHTNFVEYYCEAYSLRNVTEMLPSNTVLFHYTAMEIIVDLKALNFSHLQNIEILYIVTNSHIDDFRQVARINESVSIFQHLTNLRELHINIIWHMNGNLDDLFSPLVNLEVLDLSETQRINITNLISAFHGLKNNTKLRVLNLWNIQLFEYANSLALNLSWLLAPLKHCPLEELNIGYNALRNIHAGLIENAPLLKKLDVSHNLIIPFFTSSLLLEVFLHPTLEEAVLGYIGGYAGRRERDTRPDVPVHDGVVGADRCVFASKEWSVIVDIYSRNHEAFCQYLYEKEAATFENIPCDVIPVLHDIVDKDCAGCQVVPLGKNLRKLHMQQLNVYDTPDYHPHYAENPNCFNVNNNLEYFDLSRNKYAYGSGALAISHSTIRGFERLKVFNISENDVDTMHEDSFALMPSLEVLDLSNNLLTLSGTNEKYLFRNNTALSSLTLANNQIKILPKDQFVSQINLVFLNLSKNYIETLDQDFTSLHKLEYLDLSSNNIKFLSRTLINNLDNIVSGGMRNKILKVDLRNNELLCSCSTIEFIKWLLDTKGDKIDIVRKDSLYCLTSRSERISITKVDIDSIDQECNSAVIYASIGVGVTLAVVLIISFVVAMYRIRWKIRTWVYLFRKYHKRQCQEMADSKSYKYDAFISYNQDDRFWVHDAMRRTLEEEHNLRLCIHYRDWLAGEVIEEQILESIENSRKTILILSPNFVKSNWCHFEMQMARQKLFSKGTDILILVIYKPVSKVNRTLKNLLETKTYLQWTSDKDGQKLFWAKLVEAIEGPAAPQDTAL